MSAAITWTRTYIRYSSNRAADAAAAVRRAPSRSGSTKERRRGNSPASQTSTSVRATTPSISHTRRRRRAAEDAVRLVRHYIRRINRRRKKAGLDSCRYLLTTERGKKSGRIHHHLIISGGLSRDEMEEVWGRGRANCLRLQFDRDSGITGLSMYITKDRAMYKRWSGSRNLIQPEPMQRDGALALDDLDELGEAAEAGLGYNEIERLYPGWRCVELTGERNGVTTAGTSRGAARAGNTRGEARRE